MHTHRRSAAAGSRVIQRTWLVSGRGGKHHVGAEGRAFSAVRASQRPPAPEDRHSALGSIPAYTTSSSGPTATALTSRDASSSPAGRHDVPASPLLQTPAPVAP